MVIMMKRWDLLLNSNTVGSKSQGLRTGGKAAIEKADIVLKVIQCFQTITSAVRQRMIVKGMIVNAFGGGL